MALSPMMESMASECVVMDPKSVPDGEGGFFTGYSEGADFKTYPALDTSIQARQAEKQGVTSIYTVLIPQNVPLKVGDIYRDKTIDAYFRVTSNPEEKQTPGTSALNLKSFSAERTELPSQN